MSCFVKVVMLSVLVTLLLACSVPSKESVVLADRLEAPDSSAFSILDSSRDDPDRSDLLDPEDLDQVFETIAEASYSPLPNRLNAEPIATLATELNETSGLAFHQGTWWTMNDSGNSAALYEVSQQDGTVLRRVHPLNSENRDWEALAQDDRHLYIADCGNNRGDRHSFQIYSVPWSDLLQSKHRGVVSSAQMDIRLSDTRPESKLHAHNNDCEALAHVDGQLWLFTKNWKDQATRLYRVDTRKSKQSLTASATYPVKGLITAADFDPESRRLALLGYRIGFLSVSSFIWILPVPEEGQLPDWDNASYHRLDPAGQWEAILWHQGDLWLTRERSVLGSAQLAKITLP
ncbi:hypothetical protein D791_03433 [Nitrincola nitratireducens]|uniref:Uncharacterized protein n=1 Tax=Nitrincola nitratireducens TaxID=1229521 RepID=W9UXY9_9GAMM|nr:hypothetical protein D791_03433 [Nitrincola nitratireducens]